LAADEVSEATVTNHLISESSPYLLQHVDNPVDWYPWGEEALELARRQDKPILLSIGYAACHWCHVMAHESFEDEDTAAYMNQHFINVKVDREERPDLDSIYMSAVQAMTGQGGWPMTVILTPSGEPFFGGTYYPPQPRFGMPSFMQILTSVAHAWESRRDEIDESAQQIAERLSRSVQMQGTSGSLTSTVTERATEGVRNSFDGHQGGFGKAPKFPPSMTLEFLLRMNLLNRDEEVLHMVEWTLTKMAYGGIYDHLGGGFARYSTDDSWLVPHFEKMLYDNALLSRVYLHAWQLTGKALYRRVAEETLDFVAREMLHEQGGFYSSYDADSEGEEGKFYVWQADEIQDVLGENSGLFMLYYDVSDRGNWEGKNILNVPREPDEVARLADKDPASMEQRLALSRKQLYAARTERIWPGRDDKVLTSWNGLMLASFAEAGRVFGRPDYTSIASSAAEFQYRIMRREDGRLWRTWKAGSEPKYNAYLEDYAYLVEGLLALYQSTFDETWFIWATELAEILLTHFTDEENGGFFDTSDDHETLIHRPKEVQDNAVPSGNAMAAHVLLKLSLYTGMARYWDIAERSVASMMPFMSKYPTAFAHWLSAASLIISEPRELAIIGKPGDSDTESLLEIVFSRYRPGLVVAVGESGGNVPLLSDRHQLDGKATGYLCRNFVCKRPVNDPALLRALL
jgi:uncharacterized protein YyaL (SSP411 family)